MEKAKKVIIITGAGSGIGKACAEMLADKGHIVYGVDKNEFTSDKITALCADVTDYDAMADIFADVNAKCGRIDALINNAGFGIAGAVEDAEIVNIQNIVNVNLVALTVCSKLIVPYLKQSHGRLVNIGSVGGTIPLPYQSMYSATKAAVEVFSRALATEVRDFGVRVTCVMPGDTKTGFTASRIKDGANGGDNYAKMSKSVGKMEYDEQHGMSPNKVAKVVCKALTVKRRRLLMPVGASSKLIVFLAKILPVKLVDWIVRKMYS
ncbi:MAG: SDR family NAD(P)-dependent oxidoreductase [Firmicutes bacterium]|nr:SDR family NAD(P)-dependent oxidoreductase [Bacillota bacterium]